MKKLLMLLSFSFIFSGCIWSTKPVDVPVAIPCPQPPLLENKELPIVIFCAPTDKDAFVCVDQQNSKNLLLDALILKEELKSCEKALDAYRQVPK